MSNTQQLPEYILRLAEAIILFRRSNDPHNGLETFRKRLIELCNTSWEDYDQALSQAQRRVDIIQTDLAERKLSEAVKLVEESSALEDPYDNLALDVSRYHDSKIG